MIDNKPISQKQESPLESQAGENEVDSSMERLSEQTVRDIKETYPTPLNPPNTSLP